MSSLMMPAQSVASLLAHVFGPSYYDSPHFGHGGVGWRALAGPRPEPWRAVALNPQPLPPRQATALALADAHVHQILALDGLGALLAGDGAERTEERALGLIAEVDEICPRWPRWPLPWPPWPRQRFGDDDVMRPDELLLFGSRLLAASEVLQAGRVRDAVAALGEKAMGLSLDQQTGA
jgi:hypothetical protein